MGEITSFYDNEVMDEAIQKMLYDLFSTAQGTKAYKDALFEVTKVISELDLTIKDTDRLISPVLNFARIGMILGFQFALKEKKD